MTKKKKKPLSIRIKLEGKHSPSDLRLMLHEAINELEARDIKQVKNCNLYVTPVDEADQANNSDMIVIDRPYHCAADDHGA